MKIIIFAFIICVSHLTNAAISTELRRAIWWDGADTKVIFKVVDDRGLPLCGADVKASFWLERDGRSHSVQGLTNEEGLFSAEKKSNGEVVYVVSKEGFYKTNSRINFSGSCEISGEIKDGKWQPYGKIHTVILKPIRNPIPLGVGSFQVRKQINMPVAKEGGFDLKVGDFLPPHGNGIDADFWLTYQEKGTERVCIFAFTNALDGAYIREKDLYSEFPTVYLADTNAVYKKTILLKGDQQGRVFLPKNQYLVLRTRTKVNEKGELTEAYYSKIYGEFVVGKRGGVIFRYYRNSEINSINLEFDPAPVWAKRPLGH